MLTPAFEVKQDSNNVFLIIKAPYTNVKDCDIYVYENEVKFFSKPYFLRLNLPGNVVENGNAAAKYDADSGTFELVLPKEVPGEEFPDLQLLTKLLAPKVKPEQEPFIENIDDAPAEVLDDEEGDIWQVKQTPFEQDDVTLNGRMYGFNRKKTGVIGRMQEDLPNICDIRDPESKSVEEARAERLQQEESDFNEDHYLNDWFDEAGEIEDILGTRLDLSKVLEFNEDERALLSRLPARGFLMSKEDKLRCILGLVDLVFAWSYNNRVSDGDWHSESGWTIVKLSSTLAYFEEFTSMKAVMHSCVRRSLIYPLYRRYDLALQCWRDAAAIFRAGSKRVLKCLLDIHGALEKDSDARYILNELYIADYIVWLQRQCKPERLLEIDEKMSTVDVTKKELCLDLITLEEAAKMIEVEQKMKTMTTDETTPQSSDVPLVDALQVAASSAQEGACHAAAAAGASTVLDSDDDSAAPSSTSANSSDDYDSCEESNSSNAQSSSSSSSTSEPQSLDANSPSNRNL